MSRPVTAEQQCNTMTTFCKARCLLVQPGKEAAAAERDAEIAEPQDFVLSTEVEWEQSTTSYASSEACFEECTPEMLPLALCNLGATADGTSAAHAKLVLQHTTLPSTMPLAPYSQIQSLVLSHNCLRDLKGLEQLPYLTDLDVSHNELTQVLDIDLPAGQPSNMRRACFAHNCIGQIRSLQAFSRLEALDLRCNAIEHIAGLHALGGLRALDLGGNRLRSCRGLGGCTALLELQLDRNQITSLVGLEPLEQLRCLGVAGNQLTDLLGCEKLPAIQQLDVAGNPISMLEALAPVAAPARLAALDLRGCPLQLLQSCRLHVLYMLPWLTRLDGKPAGADEKVAAANMHGADAAGLVACRSRHFPEGELDDGGGAMLPICAGLQPSAAEEEAAEAPRDPYLLADVWAQSLGLEVAEAGGIPGLAQRLAAGCTKTGEQQQLQLARACYTWIVSHVKVPKDDLRDVHAPLFEEPLLHSRGSRVCAVGSSACAFAVTSEAHTRGMQGVGRLGHSGGGGGSNSSSSSSAAGKYGNQEQQQQALTDSTAPADDAGQVQATGAGTSAGQGPAEAALLGSTTGSWAERVSWLLVRLAKACGLLTVQIWGSARGGGLMPLLLPGQTLLAHNHSWAAVRVNGRWRLLDPAYAALRAGEALFFTPPEAFVHSHLPFESYWQLLQQPLSSQEWWALPEASPQLFAAGMQLLSGGLRAVNELPACQPGKQLPALRVLVAAPDLPSQHLQLCILDSDLVEVASWQIAGSTSAAASASAGTNGAEPTRRLLLQQAIHLQPAAAAAGASSSALPDIVQLPGMAAPTLAAAAATPGAGGPAGVLQVQFGARRFDASVWELWAAPPGPGCWYWCLKLVREMPGAVQLRVAGLEQPLCLSVKMEDTVLRAKLVVPPAAAPDASEGVEQLMEPGRAGRSMRPVPACLPSVTHAFRELRCQLLSPAAHQRLEADRPCAFRLAVPGARAVVVGSEEVGWWPLNREQCAADATVDAAAGLAAARPDPAAAELPVPVFSGEIEVPRCSTCHVLASLDPRSLPHQQSAASSRSTTGAASVAEASLGGWVPLLAITVAPQVQHVVEVPQPQMTSNFLDSEPLVHQVKEMFAALDSNSDGLVSRRELLLGFRRNRQWADFLKFPPKPREGDGSLARFHERFLQVNSDKLGFITFDQLAAAYIAERGLNRGKSASGQTAAGGLLQQHLAAAASSSGGGARPARPSTARSKASRASRQAASRSSKRAL